MTDHATAPQRLAPRPNICLDPPPAGGEIVTVDEVDRRYEDEWAIMRITAYDEHRWPTEGYLVAHHPTEDGCFDMFDEAVAAGEPHDAPHFYFIAGPKARTGAEMLAAMAQLEAEQLPAEERSGRQD